MLRQHAQVAERLMAAVSKTDVEISTVGSNPTLRAHAPLG